MILAVKFHEWYKFLCKSLILFLFYLIAERNEIHAKFSESILDMQQKSGLKYMVLEKKITAMREELDVKDAQMHDIVKVTQASDRGIFETNMI